MTIRPVCYIVLGLGMWLSTGCSSHENDGLGTTVNAAESDAAKDKKPASDAKKHAKFTNRLARETSPYLLMHSHNPVDWYAWGPEAFEKAKKEGKVIFLSIGYSSCYWCHVMERKVFENEEIAKYMNKHFVNIKVDREERPDVDDIYMTALQVMRQSGGWPLSMFLTPDGKPLIGGTYYPPYDLENRLGFSTIMKRVVDYWAKDRKELETHASLMTERLQLVMKPRLSLKPPELKRSIVNNVIGEVTSSYDSQYGGVDFNSSQPNRPKFPVPSKLSLLQYAIRQNGDSKAEKVVAHTLESIAAGGIHDHLGGGFHRYSTDRAWMVPHFEKMLYDNAQLAVVYVEAFRQTGKPVYRHTAENIFTFIKNEMTHSDGGFFSAMDAETNAIEGESYVWTKKEIDKILGVEDSKLFQTVYGLEAKKYFEHGYILHLPDPIETVAERLKLDPTELSKKLAVMRPKLLAIRKKRDQPFLDDKVLTSWNGLMIRAYANAGTVLKRDEYIAAAAKAATFLLTHLRDDQGRLLRTYRVKTAKLNAYLDDYAFLVEGLLALYDATKNEEWLKHARELVDQQIKLFWDDKGKGFYFTSHHHETLLARTKNAYDSVIPSGNSVSARNLIRLATITGESKYRDVAKEILFLFVARVEEVPRGMTNMSLALGEFLDSESKDKPATKPAKAETSKPAVEETKKQQADKTIDKK